MQSSEPPLNMFLSRLCFVAYSQLLNGHFIMFHYWRTAQHTVLHVLHWGLAWVVTRYEPTAQLCSPNLVHIHIQMIWFRWKWFIVAPQLSTEMELSENTNVSEGVRLCSGRRWPCYAWNLYCQSVFLWTDFTEFGQILAFDKKYRRLVDVQSWWGATGAHWWPGHDTMGPWSSHWPMVPTFLCLQWPRSRPLASYFKPFSPI